MCRAGKKFTVLLAKTSHLRQSTHALCPAAWDLNPTSLKSQGQTHTNLQLWAAISVLSSESTSRTKQHSLCLTGRPEPRHKILTAAEWVTAYTQASKTSLRCAQIPLQMWHRQFSLARRLVPQYVYDSIKWHKARWAHSTSGSKGSPNLRQYAHDMIFTEDPSKRPWLPLQEQRHLKQRE